LFHAITDKRSNDFSRQLIHDHNDKGLQDPPKPDAGGKRACAMRA